MDQVFVVILVYEKYSVKSNDFFWTFTALGKKNKKNMTDLIERVLFTSLRL